MGWVQSQNGRKTVNGRQVHAFEAKPENGGWWIIAYLPNSKVLMGFFKEEGRAINEIDSIGYHLSRGEKYRLREN